MLDRYEKQKVHICSNRWGWKERHCLIDLDKKCNDCVKNNGMSLSIFLDRVRKVIFLYG